MTDPSPVCEVREGAGAYVSTTNGFNATPSSSITIKLADVAGVEFWSIACIGTDELRTASTINAGMSIDMLAKTATFTAPASGAALLFQSTVGITGLGLDANGDVQEEYTTTFCIFTLASMSGLRVGAVNEIWEGSSAWGWAAKLNPLIRNPSGIPAGGTPGQVFVNTGPGVGTWGPVDLDDTDSVTGTLAEANQEDQTMGNNVTGTTGNAVVIKINGASVPVSGSLVTGNGLYVSGPSALTYSALNLGGGSGWVTGTLPSGNIGAAGSEAEVQINTSGLLGAATRVKAGTDWLSIGTNPSTTGSVRLLFGGNVYTRNEAGSGNLFLIGSGSGPSIAVGDATAGLFTAGSNVTEYVSTGGVWQLQINAVQKAQIDTSAVTLSVPTLTWTEGTASPTITVNTRATNDPTTTLSIVGQAPNAGATSTNRNSGPVIIKPSAAIAGGIEGAAAVQDSSGTWGFSTSGSSASAARLFHGSQYAQLRSTYFDLSVPCRVGPNAAQTGAFGCYNNTGLYVRNAANSADLAAIVIDSGNACVVGNTTGTTTVQGSGTTTVQGATAVSLKSNTTVVTTVNATDYRVDYAADNVRTYEQEKQTTTTTSGQTISTNAITVDTGYAYRFEVFVMGTKQGTSSNDTYAATLSGTWSRCTGDNSGNAEAVGTVRRFGEDTNGTWAPDLTIEIISNAANVRALSTLPSGTINWLVVWQVFRRSKS